MLLGKGPGQRNLMIYYNGDEVYAIRKGLTRRTSPPLPGTAKNRRQKHDPPLLFHLPHDPGERFDIAADHPRCSPTFSRNWRKYRATLVPGKRSTKRAAGYWIPAAPLRPQGAVRWDFRAGAVRAVGEVGRNLELDLSPTFMSLQASGPTGMTAFRGN